MRALLLLTQPGLLRELPAVCSWFRVCSVVTGRLHFRDLIPTDCLWLSLANLNDAVFGIERIPKGLGVHRGVLPAWEFFLSTSFYTKALLQSGRARPW